MHNCVTPPPPQQKKKKTYQDNKKEEWASRLQTAPRSLPRHWPIQDKLPGLVGGRVGSEVNFNGNPQWKHPWKHQARGRDHTHTHTHTHERSNINITSRRRRCRHKRSSMSKCNFGYNENNTVLSLHPLPCLISRTNECETHRKRLFFFFLLSPGAKHEKLACFGDSISQSFERVLQHISPEDREIKDETHAISLKCTEFHLCQFQKCHEENDLETWLTPPMLRYFLSQQLLCWHAPSHNRFNRETHNAEQKRDVFTRLDS